MERDTLTREQMELREDLLGEIQAYQEILNCIRKQDLPRYKVEHILMELGNLIQINRDEIETKCS